MLYKLYRKNSQIFARLASILRVLNLKLKYPSLAIDFKTTINQNTNIIICDGAKSSIINCVIAQGTVIRVEKGAHFDVRNSYIGFNCVIACREKIIINNHCEIAEMVVIRDQDHIYDTNILIKDSGYNNAPVIIGENVWIGAKSTVLKNTTIGNNCIVGAHSLVKNITTPENSIWVGTPAKQIGFTHKKNN